MLLIATTILGFVKGGISDDETTKSRDFTSAFNVMARRRRNDDFHRMISRKWSCFFVFNLGEYFR